MKDIGNLILGLALFVLGALGGWIYHEFQTIQEVTSEVSTVVSHDIYSDIRSSGVCVSCCPVEPEAETPIPTEEPVCVLASPTSGPTDTHPTETPQPTERPTNVPTATPSPQPTDTPIPNPTKVKCNNGGGNGPEGCSPSEQGHDDENQDHKHGGGHKKNK